jgi:ABC-type glycerol-3-phosphate transport system permease component
MSPIKNPVARAFIYLVLLVFSLYSVTPFLWTALQSLKTVRQAFARNPLFIFEPTFQNYSRLWINATPENFGFLGMIIVALFVTFILLLVYSSRIPAPKSVIYVSAIISFILVLYLVPRLIDTAEFYNYFVNSVIVTIGVVVISMTIGCIAGYGLARYTGIDSIIILIIALGFRALPRMAFALPYYSIGLATGLYDTYFIVIMVLVASNQPFTIWMMSAFFADIPKELEEAASIDGLGPFAAFFRVIIPSAWPGIISTGLFSMLLAYHEFLLVRVLTQSKWTLPVAIVQFTGGEAPGHVTLAAAAAVSTTIPIIIVIIFFQKHLVKGLTGGSVKG